MGNSRVVLCELNFEIGVGFGGSKQPFKETNIAIYQME
jgi:hypothetical protein